MTTLVKTVCQNCFTDLNKAATGSNFCCQQCFDEWITKQHMKTIRAFHEVLANNTPFHLMESEMDRRLK